MKSIVIDGLNFQLLISNKEILNRIIYLSKKIKKKYQNEWPIFLIVLNGATVFASELLKHIDPSVEFSLIKVHSYKGMGSSGKMNLDYFPTQVLKNKKILLIEDIVDSGLTLNFLKKELKKHCVKDIECVTLLFKKEKYNYEIIPEYIGFNIDDEFVVGYGMDLNQKGRNFKHIYKNILDKK